jgi:hypothetical protein
MKTTCRILCLASLIFFAITAQAQQRCENSCFNTEIIATQKISETCTQYEWRVSYSGKCDHALSHFTASIPCGKISNLSNSENWKQEFGFDKTTGLSGFKIDDIQEFGETSLQSFTVKFTLCSDNAACTSQLSCWQPVIAYKASTCVDYDTLQTSCSQLKARIEKIDASCFGASDGSLTVFAEDGTKPYQYLWSTGATTEILSDVAAGNYNVIVRDASGKEITLEASVGQPEKIIANGSIQQATCSGSTDGAIDLSVSGGTAPYQYLWSNNSTLEDINGLKAGTYSVVVSDATGCSVKSTFSVGNSSQIIITAAQSLPDCNQQNGSLNITVSGGTAPYTYYWSNNAITEDLANVGSGIYKITVSDSKGCSAEVTYNLRENNTLKLTANTTQTSCLDDASGAIDLTVTGGTAPYTYSWTNGSTSADLSGLTSGNYTVTVTDSKGCTATLRVFVAKKSFQVPSMVIQPSCTGETTGSITLQTPVGGEGPFTYVWSNGATGNTITGLAPGTYYVTVTDATGCTRNLVFVITNPTPINATATVSNEQCNTEGFYNIDLTVSGGKAPYTYEWSNGGTTQDLDSLQSGTYTVVIKDANGCTTTQTIVIDQADQTFSCNIIQPDSIPVCNSVNNILNSAVTNADSYSWSVQSSDGRWAITGGALTGSIQYSTGGVNSSATFTLVVEKDGCSKVCTYTITTCTDNSGGEDPGGEDPGGEDPGGEDPGGEDPGGENPGEENPGNETCEECFDSMIKNITENGSCTSYEITVSTNGNCRHDLSHWVLAIPCGSVKEYSNSEGWKMSVGQDPTSGVYGLKVDDIHGFGSSKDSFTVKFTICGDNACNTTLENWNPLVAYKASTCVGYDSLENNSSTTAFNAIAYPNPFSEQLTFEWVTPGTEQVKVELLDQFGNVVKTVYSDRSESGFSYHKEISASAMYPGIYYYRVTASGKTRLGKLIKN